MADLLITAKTRSLSLLFVAAIVVSSCFAAWQLASSAGRFAALAADTTAPSELFGGALLDVETLQADTELLTITQSMAANEQVAGAIATHQAQFIARMDRLAARFPGEFSPIEALKQREDALLHQACRRPLLLAAAATSVAENAAAQTAFLSDCLPLMQSVAQDMTSEQKRVQAQAALTARALQAAAARATEAALAMIVGSLSLATLCAACLLRAGVFKQLAPLQAPADPRAEGAASPAA